MFIMVICVMVTGFGFQLWLAPNKIFKATAWVPLSKRIISRISSPNEITNRCKPVQNFAFVKTHKTGSTTLKTVLNRFGYAHNLSFILYEDSSTGHFNYKKIVASGNKTNILPPIGVMFGDYDHYRGYNISNVHLPYNHSLYRQLMHPKSLYISILREPSSQWLSAFRYFRVYKVLKRQFSNMTDAVEEFMKAPDRYKNKNAYAWNNQLLDLGLEKVHFSNKTKIMKHVKLLEKDLKLVLITEYFDESLILLKKLFCWSMDDIIYIKQREQGSHITVNDTLRRKILDFNSGDSQLYGFFNKTFWKKVRQYGPSFDNDLREFRTRLKDLEKQCIHEGIEKPAGDGRIYIQYVKKQGVEEVLCDMLINVDFQMETLIQSRQGGTNSSYRAENKKEQSGIPIQKNTLANQTFTKNSTTYPQDTEIN